MSCDTYTTHRGLLPYDNNEWTRAWDEPGITRILTDYAQNIPRHWTTCKLDETSTSIATHCALIACSCHKRSGLLGENEHLRPNHRNKLSKFWVSLILLETFVSPCVVNGFLVAQHIILLWLWRYTLLYCTDSNKFCIDFGKQLLRSGLHHGPGSCLRAL